MFGDTVLSITCFLLPELPQLVLLTKVDEISSFLKEDVSDVYKSQAVKEKVNAVYCSACQCHCFKQAALFLHGQATHSVLAFSFVFTHPWNEHSALLCS